MILSTFLQFHSQYAVQTMLCLSKTLHRLINHLAYILSCQKWYLLPTSFRLIFFKMQILMTELCYLKPLFTLLEQSPPSLYHDQGTPQLSHSCLNFHLLSALFHIALHSLCTSNLCSISEIKQEMFLTRISLSRQNIALFCFVCLFVLMYVQYQQQKIRLLIER